MGQLSTEGLAPHIPGADSDRMLAGINADEFWGEPLLPGNDPEGNPLSQLPQDSREPKAAQGSSTESGSQGSSATNTGFVSSAPAA